MYQTTWAQISGGKFQNTNSCCRGVSMSVVLQKWSQRTTETEGSLMCQIDPRDSGSEWRTGSKKTRILILPVFVQFWFPGNTHLPNLEKAASQNSRIACISATELKLVSCWEQSDRALLPRFGDTHKNGFVERWELKFQQAKQRPWHSAVSEEKIRFPWLLGTLWSHQWQSILSSATS